MKVRRAMGAGIAAGVLAVTGVALTAGTAQAQPKNNCAIWADAMDRDWDNWYDFTYVTPDSVGAAYWGGQLNADFGRWMGLCS